MSRLLLLSLLAGSLLVGPSGWAAPDPQVQDLVAKAEHGNPAERRGALRRLAELDSASETRRLIPRLEQLAPSDPETAELLRWWLARPHGPTAQAAGRWVEQHRAKVPLATPNLPRVQPPSAEDATFLVAAQLLADRPDSKEAQGGLALLLLYPDEAVARAAAAGLTQTKPLAAGRLLQVLPLALLAHDPVLESRLLTVAAQVRDLSLMSALLTAAEAAEARGDATEHLQALRAVAGVRRANVAAYRSWWAQHAPRR